LKKSVKPVKQCGNCIGRKMPKLSLFLSFLAHQFCGVIDYPPSKGFIVFKQSPFSPEVAGLKQRYWLLLLNALLFGFAHNATAQNISRENSQYTTFSSPLKAEPTNLLDGTWQPAQSSFNATPVSQTRTEVVAVLANLLVPTKGGRLRQPDVVSVSVTGRSAMAIIDSQYKEGFVKEVVRLRLEFGVWQITDIDRL
jgi:hypothetical protein